MAVRRQSLYSLTFVGFLRTIEKHLCFFFENWIDVFVRMIKSALSTIGIVDFVSCRLE